MAHKIPPDRQISRKNIYNLLFPFHLNLVWSTPHIDTLNKSIKNFSLDKYYRLKEPDVREVSVFKYNFSRVKSQRELSTPRATSETTIYNICVYSVIKS